MNCPNPDTLSDLVDAAMPAFFRWRLHRHIRHCSSCAAQLEQEERLRERVRTVGADVTAPAPLRQRVRNLLSAEPKRPAMKPRRAFAQSLVVAMVGTALLLSILYLPPKTSIVRPQPAYAEVVRAMRLVETARWQRTYSRYEANTGKSNNSKVHYLARRDPATLITFYSSGQVERRTEPRDWEKRIAYPADVSRTEAEWRNKWGNEMFDKLTAPASTGNGPYDWHSKPVTIKRRRLIRFSSGIGGTPHETPDARQTTRGYRTTVWVDQDTLRVVYAVDEYYDGQTHTRIQTDHIQYDVPFPADK